MRALFFTLIVLLNAAVARSFEIESFLNRPLIVQQIENEKIKNSFLGFFKMGADQNTFISDYVNQMAQNFGAACITKSSTNCKYENTFEKIFFNQFKINFASAVRAAEYAAKFASMTAKVESNYETIDAETFKIEINLNGASQIFIVTKKNILSDSLIKFADVQEAASVRKPIGDVTLQEKELSKSVVQIIKSFDLNKSLYGGSGSSGTGFFISEDGYLLTNHHVIAEQRECVQNLSCLINLKQTQPDGTEKNIQVAAHLIAMSVFHDFALIKLNLKQKLTIRPLKINLKNVETNLITLGYPGDKVVNDKFVLTYSYGQPMGFNSNGLKTTNFIFGGASGSPLINQESEEVIGIMSNGEDVRPDGTGSAGTARLLSYIESEFGISEYLTGQKQARIKGILQNVRKSVDEDSVTKSLKLLSAEKSFYGLPLLKQIMIDSDSKIVRKKIMEYLQGESLLSGQSSH